MRIVGLVHYSFSEDGEDLGFQVVHSLEECDCVIRALLRVPGVFSAGVTFTTVEE